jgi:hypothetical protein
MMLEIQWLAVTHQVALAPAQAHHSQLCCAMLVSQGAQDQH